MPVPLLLGRAAIRAGAERVEGDGRTGRPREVPEEGYYFVTSRCFQGRLLLRPSAKVNEGCGSYGSVFCTTYLSAPVCTGQQPSCTYCHVAPPQRNAFGAGLESYLAPGAPRPLSDNDFAYALPTAQRGGEAVDADGDGVSNLVEIQRGTLPADANSVPVDTSGCAAGSCGSWRTRRSARWARSSPERTKGPFPSPTTMTTTRSTPTRSSTITTRAR